MKKSSLIAKITQDLSVSIIPFSLRKLHFATPSDKTVFRSDRTGCNDRFCTLVYLSTLSQTKPREQCPDVQGVTPLECPSSIIPTTNNSRWTVWKKVPQITQTGHRSVSPESLVSRILTKKNIGVYFLTKYLHHLNYCLISAFKFGD